jgi:N-acetylglucosamine-6-sulfatase
LAQLAGVTKHLRIASLFVSLFLQACQSVISPPVLSTATIRPNILVILSDDQRYDTMDYMPKTMERIFKQGVAFPSAYSTTSLCCPSRASILTGMYAHNHGVHLNPDPLEKETLVERVHNAGYYTGQVGKYLNSWDGSARPEFDFWVASRGGRSYYFNQNLNVNGTWSVHPGYVTHVLRDYALEFLRRAARQDKPFLLLFSPNNPHFTSSPSGKPPRGAKDNLRPPRPAPGDESLYENLAPHRPPSFDKTDASAKPRWFQSLPPLTPDLIAMLETFRRRQLQSLNALDLAVESLLDELARQGKLDDTLVIYLSDNGYFWGEHRIPYGKNSVYEESSRIPFAVRYPRLVAKPRVETRLVANIDIAPTIYDLARIPIPTEVDGRSLVPLLSGNSKTNPSFRWREDLLLEGWPSPAVVDEGRAAYAAIHTGRYVYVETEGDRLELYDLTTDPHQLQNQVENPTYAPVLADLKARLRRTKRKS